MDHMKTVVGILRSRSDAELVAERLRTMGMKDQNINLLTPDTSEDDLAEIPTTEAEQPGIGPVLGGVVGGALGAAGGMGLGAAVATLLVPGVGPVLAIGLASAVLLGAGGAAGGAAMGTALEDKMDSGLPTDELFVYEDALRKGRSVVIALADDDPQAEQARTIMVESGAETVDAARENWWVGLRDDEKAHYSTENTDFDEQEGSYRHGFESALRPPVRGKSFSEAARHLNAVYRKEHNKDAFRRGYERGRYYYFELRRGVPGTENLEEHKEAKNASK
jgi:hypothetical protein